MGTLGAALSALLTADVHAVAARYRRNATLWAIIATLLGSAYVFALAAITLAFTERYSPVAVAATMAVVLLVTALILMAVLAALHARDRRLAEEHRRRARLQSNLALVAAASILRNQPLLAVAAAVAVGAVLGLGKGRRHSEKS
jgi:uncharacterized membrane protein YdcZ (DUF606 family)